jgi:hypothetical protein
MWLDCVQSLWWKTNTYVVVSRANTLSISIAVWLRSVHGINVSGGGLNDSLESGDQWLGRVEELAFGDGSSAGLDVRRHGLECLRLLGDRIDVRYHLSGSNGTLLDGRSGSCQTGNGQQSCADGREMHVG